MTPLPDTIVDVEQLEDLLSRPTPLAVEAMRQVEGDLLLLGVAGKLGPTLARMAVRASEAAGVSRRIVGVSRFSDPEARRQLEQQGVETIQADLLDFEGLSRLPDAPNVLYLAGMKFGSSGDTATTWAVNSYLPGRVCERFRGSRMAAFSTGNVYGLTPVTAGGSMESDPPRPTGEYAMSCLGRERIFEYFARAHQTPVSLIRLNYACELRYGVLVDLAHRIRAGDEIDLSMGNMNVVWQGDANAQSLATLTRASSPAFVINLAGPEMLSVERVCRQLADRMGCEVRFRGTPAPDALLSNAQRAQRLFGSPTVAIEQLLDWIADWVARGGASLGKPTKFEVRDGTF